jgi:uncharacterized membrane protein
MTRFSDITYKFIKQAGINVNHDEWSLVLESHPDYPKVNSLTETLEQIGTECKVFEVSSKKDISSIPAPFLYYVPDKGFRMATTHTNPDLHTLFEKAEPVIIIAAASDGNYKNKWKTLLASLEIKKTYSPALILIPLFVICAIITATSYSDHSIFNFLYELLLLSGLLLSTLIVFQKFGIQSSINDKICPNAEKGCKSVLFSGGNKIAGIELMDLCVIFFGGSWLAIQFSRLFDFSPELLYYLPLLALPFCIYSIIYQSLLGSWCTLCLSIVAILIMMSFASYNLLFANNSIDFSATLFAKHSIAFATVIAIWFILKQQLTTNKSRISLLKENNRIKRNPELFVKLVEKQRQVPVTISDSDLFFGNPKAQTRITLVVSPFCNYCADAFKDVSTIALSAPEEFCLVVRLLYKQNSSGEKISRSEFICEELYKTCREEMIKGNSFIEILQNWYHHFNLAKLKKKYPRTATGQSTEILKENANWCMTENITHSPTLVVNDHLFPSEYRIRDIGYFFSTIKNEVR